MCSSICYCISSHIIVSHHSLIVVELEVIFCDFGYCTCGILIHIEFHNIFYSLKFCLSSVSLSFLLNTTSGCTRTTFQHLSNIDLCVSYQCFSCLCIFAFFEVMVIRMIIDCPNVFYLFFYLI